MTSKQIALCNSALLLVGANRISSFDEQSTEAIACNEFYHRSYKALLASYPWKFAQKVSQLAEIANETPPDDWYQFTYRVPQDYVWIQRLFPNQERYDIMGDRLYSTYNPVKMKYTWLVKEELMPIWYEQTFTHYLAYQICYSITESREKTNDLYTMYRDHVKTAKGLDAQQQPQVEFADFPIDSARYEL